METDTGLAHYSHCSPTGKQDWEKREDVTRLTKERLAGDFLLGVILH